MKKILSVILSMCLFVGLTNAQGFNITPTSIQMNLNEGETFIQEMVVKNTSNEKKEFNIEVSDWMMDIKGTPSYMAGGTLPNSCAKWILLSESFIELAPNESKTIQATIKPSNFNAATHWAVVLVSPADEQMNLEYADQESLMMGGQVVMRLGVPIFNTDNTSTDGYSAKISDIKTEMTDKGLGYNVMIENTGKKVIFGNVYTTLSNIQTGEEIQLDPFLAAVLPESKRLISFQLPKKVPAGTYTLTCIMDYHEDLDYEGTQTEVTIN